MISYTIRDREFNVVDTGTKPITITDRIRILPTNKYYQPVLIALREAEKHHKRINEKRLSKR